MVKLFGVAIDKIIHKELSPGLLPGTLYATAGPGERDPDRLTGGRVDSIGSIHSFRGIEQSYSSFEIDNELVEINDRKFLMIALSLSPMIEPQTGMLMAMDSAPSVLYRIIRVSKDPATATWVCQGR